ncbi:hypothetical protein [Streptomyces sp. R41]|uniref:Response regulatory domain-containing protein n=1 Tax=Streptomyces sp. R41 TaxID=3238632 RepID=A0AB39RRY2_9ACTN
MSDAAEESPLTINVLGELEFIPSTPALTDLKSRARQVLILLVLAMTDERTAEELSRRLRPDPPLHKTTVHQYLGDLRTAGIPLRQRGTHPERYSLDPERVTVDAWQLIEGVNAGPTPDEINRLAQLWRGDPERAHPVGSWLWGRVQRARDELVRLIEGLAPTDRPRDAVLGRLAPELVGDAAPGARRAALPRVLVIDDLHAETVAHQVLASDCECRCDSITSFDEWIEFKDEVDVGVHYQAALVDLHLNNDPAVDDKLGLAIIKWLRDRTEIPVAAVSSAPGSGLALERARLRAEYRLVEIVDKGRENRYLNEIPDVVSLLLGNNDASRRVRLETWLMHAKRHWSREAFERHTPGEALTRMQKEYQAADMAVRHGELEEAAALVEEFCRTWKTDGDSFL